MKYWDVFVPLDSDPKKPKVTQIEIRQLGLATGVIIIVKRVKP